MSIKSKIHFCKNAVSLLLYDLEDDPDKAAQILVCAIKQGINFAFDNSKIDRSAERREFTIKLFTGMMNRIKGVSE